MKLQIDDDIVVYLNKCYKYNKDLENREEAQKLVQNIINKYNLELNGFLEIRIYLDDNYGAILKIKKEDIDYIDCFGLDLETDIKIIKKTFLYKLDDYAVIDNIKDYNLITYKDEIYIELKKESNIDIGKIIENSTIIYGEKTYEIKKNGKTEVIT